ncbi:glutamate-gated chloride channel-like [Argiope bruennichi]|uniref:glutamate-gated chloride channel-like n=1 Tax=Argiope bruennichi TaxID=94029 RepID=UPI002493FCD3|nr:glutamate-gated chloride channel-like [Argiope bruennichi]
MKSQLFVCLIAALLSLAASASKTLRGVEGEQIQRYFGELKKSGYDKNVMPEGSGGYGSPVQVRCEMYLIDISEVNDLHMDFRAMMYFRQIWNDSRLAYPNQPIRSIVLNDRNLIWTPDLFFFQEKEGIHHSLISPNTFIRITRDGEVRYSVRVSMTFKCPMDFTKYPHDIQKCDMQIESYGSTRDRLDLSWLNPVAFDKNISTVNFALKDVQESVNHLVLNSGQYASLQVSLVFKRKTGFFMIRLYAPFLILVAISWLCFWIPAKMLSLRLPLLLVVLYLMFHIGSDINGRSPPVSYTKGSDVWIAVCESLVFVSFLETIIVHMLYRRKGKSMRKNDPETQNILEMDEKMNQVNGDSSISLVASRLKCDGKVYKRVDRICAFLFPSLFVIFNFVYGLMYCCGRQSK